MRKLPFCAQQSYVEGGALQYPLSPLLNVGAEQEPSKEGLGEGQ